MSDEVIVFNYGGGSNVNPLAPDTMHTAVKMITDCLYVGPRVVTAGFRTLRDARKVRSINAEDCGAVLYLLYTENRKLSFQQIFESVSWIDPAEVFPELRTIKGVMFLQAEPPGLKLSEDLRNEIQQEA